MFFIGIVKQEDADNGVFEPSYVLYKSHGGSAARTGWRVLKIPEAYESMNRVLVATPCGHDDMIAFLSHYRTRDHMHDSRRYSHEATKKYYPKGFLCWFECNQFGDQIGEAIIVKRVPDKTNSKSDIGMVVYMDSQTPDPLWMRFSKDDTVMDLTESSVKPILYQERVPKGSTHGVALK